jgi:hypothetical protein
MSRRPLRLPAVSLALAGALLSSAAFAQAPNRNELNGTISVTGVNQFDSDLDRGGSTGWASVIANSAWSWQVTPQLGAGVTLRYDYEKWRFSNPVAFQGQAPWDQLNAISLGFNLDYAYSSDLRFGMAPVIEWAYETGASASNVLNYGAIVSATRIFSPQLVLGVGVGVFRQIDETKVFPFLIVQWQIDDHWRLANPFRAGPAGGAGLELTYAVDENWEIAGGGAYRSYRFRLNDIGIAPGGVGENRFFPLFVRASRKFGPATRLDLYAGASTGGRVSVDSAQGNQVARDDYKTAPAIGLTLSHRY